MEQMAISPEGYIEIKKKIREKLNEAACGFIVIGYYLKQVRDSGAYREDGYGSVEEFAHAEYGLSASTAARFMDINTEFSKGGGSLEIKDEYRNYGYSKLQEMLTVDEADRALITEDATVRQIRELRRMEKDEERAAEEERQRSLPLVKAAAMAAGGASAQESVALAEPLDAFGKVAAAFWRENGELFAKAAAGLLTPGIAAEEICPSGSRTYRHGPNMMFFYDVDKGMNLRAYEKGAPVITKHSYREFLERTAEMIAEGMIGIGAEKPDEDNACAADAPDAMPQYARAESRNAESRTACDVADDDEAAIDGECREIVSGNSETVSRNSEIVSGTGECADKRAAGSRYTDLEIEGAIGYFETEYERMTNIAPERALAKARHYRIALECIRAYQAGR